jgi:hypothetical protein
MRDAGARVMVKLLEVIGRRADFTHERFIKHQLTTHLEVVGRVPEFFKPVRRYMQNHLIIDGARLASIQGLPISVTTDSIIEVWYDAIADIHKAFQEPRYYEIIRPDELAFGDVAGAWGVATHDSNIVERPAKSGRIKLFVFLRRKDGLSHEDFTVQWKELRDRRFLSAKACRNVVLRMDENWVTQDPAESLPGMKPYDVVVELWFASLSDVAVFAADPDVIGALTGPEAGYGDAASTLIYLGEEQPGAAEWLRKAHASI